jgi:hypothetical protein
MDLIEMFKDMIESASKESLSDDDIQTKWTQVGKLSPEDMTRRRNLYAASLEAKRECDLLKKKLRAVIAKMEVDRDQFWNDCYKTYGLPEGNYHMHEDGRIFMEPKGKDE